MTNLKTISILLFILLVTCLPFLVFAQASIPINVPNPTRGIGDDLMSLIRALLNRVVMPIGAVLCVVWIIYAGFKYVTAQGNPKKIEEAHRTLLWALIGTGILLGAAGISAVIETTIRQVVNIN